MFILRNHLILICLFCHSTTVYLSAFVYRMKCNFGMTCNIVNWSVHLGFRLLSFSFPLRVSSEMRCPSSPFLLTHLCSLVLATATMSPYLARPVSVLSERMDLWHASRGCVNKRKGKYFSSLLRFLKATEPIINIPYLKETKNKTCRYCVSNTLHA